MNGSLAVVERPQATNSEVFDAIVIGAGISGLTTAYLLAKAGRQVLVLDDGPVAGGMTMATTAHITNMSPLFVLTWYSLGILLAVGGGALLGPRLMRW